MVVFYSLLNVAGINSQVVYVGNGNEVLRRRLFLRHVGRELTEDQLVKRSVLYNLPPTLSRRNIEILPQNRRPLSPIGDRANNAETNQGSRKRCEPCQSTSTRRLTKYSYKSCGQYLCLQHCDFFCHDGCGSSPLSEEP
jgi:hypothetical protein